MTKGSLLQSDSVKTAKNKTTFSKKTSKNNYARQMWNCVEYAENKANHRTKGTVPRKSV
jgi:hypothetical protein